MYVIGVPKAISWPYGTIRMPLSVTGSVVAIATFGSSGKTKPSEGECSDHQGKNCGAYKFFGVVMSHELLSRLIIFLAKVCCLHQLKKYITDLT